MKNQNFLRNFVVDLMKLSLLPQPVGLLELIQNVICAGNNQVTEFS